jgi:transposase
MPKPRKIKRGSGTNGEVKVPPAKRRTFSAAEKLRIVREAAECKEPGEIGALLRREGLHSSHLSYWRRLVDAHGSDGMGSIKRGRKAKQDAKDRRIVELEKKLARADKELAIAQGLLEVQKKVSSLLGITLPTSENS